MRIFVPKEIHSTERRVPLLPSGAAKLVGLGIEIEVEQGLGVPLNCTDSLYEKAGAKISSDRAGSMATADLLLRVRKPSLHEVDLLKKGCIHASFLDPFNERELVLRLATAGVTAVSMEMIPRTAVAQKMDVLSSQANLSGYVSVIIAATDANRIFPMLITPAGTIKPVRVLVIGVGVAGLQAIATARRLGAAVEAFDTRPIVEEQVRSLGAKFVKADLGETGETVGGYAKPLTPEQLQKQRAIMTQHIAQADVVITAAQVFGKKAPIIVTTEMVRQMRPGSVVVDTAIETGGNVECSRYDEVAEVNGVRIISFANLPSRVAANASEMYSNNMSAFVEHFWDKSANAFLLDFTNDILKQCVITHAGKICNETIRAAYG
ncbi:MAG: NAD(P) transhydrogenase subunit alpha [Verrucomicrobia bacterium]|nr:NAD(P) transhydrogenase subunit alpha [Verrucomicrobiota bacterium]